MTGFALLPEPFAVVAGDRDHRPGEEAALAKFFHHGAEQVIHVGDLAVVRAPGEILPIGRRRGVRRMGVEEVHPRQERLLRRLVQPAGEDLVDLLGLPFRVQRLERRAFLEVVIVDVESLVQPEAGIHGKGSDESRRRVAPVFKDLGQGRLVGRERVAPVIADAVNVRIGSRQDRGVGGKRQRDGGVGLDEAHAAGGQGVQVRGLGARVPVAPEPVGPRRVQSDQQNVEAGFTPGLDLPGSAEEQKSPRGENDARGGQERGFPEKRMRRPGLSLAVLGPAHGRTRLPAPAGAPGFLPLRHATS